jgi:hypothetical protein
MEPGTTADFGTSSSLGNNAFTQNNTGSLGGHNLDNSTEPPPTPTPSTTPIAISAIGNEWQHCYASSPALNCNGPISSSDVGGTGASKVTVSSPLSQEGNSNSTPPMLPHIDQVIPIKAKAGDLIHIIGSGFNAIDPYTQGGSCASIGQTNNVVAIVPDSNLNTDTPLATLTVISVTPTEIVAQLPVGQSAFSCNQSGLSVRVRRPDYTGNPLPATKEFCTNQ